jgi:hypothetical protein
MASLLAAATQKYAAFRAPNASQLLINHKPCALRGRRLRGANASSRQSSFEKFILKGHQ